MVENLKSCIPREFQGISHQDGISFGCVRLQEQRFRLHSKTTKNEGSEEGLPPCRCSRTARGVYPPPSYGWGVYPPSRRCTKGGFTPCHRRTVRGVPKSCWSIPPPACLFSFLTLSTPPNCTSLLLIAQGLPPQPCRRTLGGISPPSCTS